MLTAVLGTGPAGQALASRLAGVGHEVVMGTRNIADTMARPELASWLVRQPHVNLAPFAGAARAADMVVNVTSGAATLDVLGSPGQTRSRARFSSMPPTPSAPARTGRRCSTR